MTPTKTTTDYKQLSVLELQDHINCLENTNKNVWEFIQAENPGRKEFTHLRMMASQHSVMIKKCNARLDQLKNSQTVSGKRINEFNRLC